MRVDPNWLESAIEWALNHGPELPACRDVALAALRGPDPASKAAASLYLAMAAFSTGNRYEAAWRLGNAANGIGGLKRTAPEEAAPWLVIAMRIFDALVEDEDKYVGSANWARDTLAEIAVNPEDFDPVKNQTVVRRPEVVSASASGDPLRAGVPRPLRQASPADDEVLQEEIAKEWSEAGAELSLATKCTEYEKFLQETLATTPTLLRYLTGELATDFAWLASTLSGWRTPTKPHAIAERARVTRSWALASDVSNPDLEPIARRRWLVTGLWNWLLWEDCKWETNEPQARLDMIGLVESMLICRRYRNGQRDFLLEAAEATIRLLHRHAPELLHYPWVRRWLVNASGVYLLLAGPDPTPPARTPHKEREYGLKNREAWAGYIAGSAIGLPEKARQVAFCFAALANWDRDTLDWLLEVLFASGEQEADPLTANEWFKQACAFIDLGIGIGIANNPWGRTAAANDESHHGQFAVSSAMLRVAAAETTAHAPRMATLVTSGPFGGRRVPTYVVYDQYGVSGILKLDSASRVHRERHNFRDIARGSLHESNRPNECVTGSVTFPVPGVTEPLRGIFTSYVFAEGDTPATLTQVVRSVPEEHLSEVMHSLFARVLKPWLAHARRQSVDLRRAYSLLNPIAPDTADQVNPELRKLQSAEIVSTMGCPLTPESDDFMSLWTSVASHVGVNLNPQGFVNPVWLAAQLSSAEEGPFARRVFEPPNPLCAYSTLVTTCHGDLHGDNVLCALRDHRVSRIVIIDFEAAHNGHVCKDVARLEASLLVQTWDWSDDELAEVAALLMQSLKSDHPFDLDIRAGGAMERAARGVSAIRRAVAGCSQVWWPITSEEYAIALLCGLLPIARYWTEQPRRRAGALLLAATVAPWLVQRFDSEPSARSVSMVHRDVDETGHDGT